MDLTPKEVLGWSLFVVGAVLAVFAGFRAGGISIYQRQKLERMKKDAAQTPSLPTLSFLNTDIDLTPADYTAGLQALREAGL